jgi:hypothetical protein
MNGPFVGNSDPNREHHFSLHFLDTRRYTHLVLNAKTGCCSAGNSFRDQTMRRTLGCAR